MIQVSIVHWNRPDECLATVAALCRQNIPLQISVVDNDSRPELYERLQRGLPSAVSLIRLPTNCGWGRAHNVVLQKWLAESTTEFCIVSAHDALPSDNCLDTLLRAMAAHPQWGMACPDYGIAELPRYSVLRGARRVPSSPRPAGATEAVEYCHGTLSVVRRRCLQEIGVFDDGYFAYGDETEIGLRARRAGWLVGLVWGVSVVNPGSWSGGPVIGYLWARNSIRMGKTYGGWIGACARFAYVAASTCALAFMRADRRGLSSPPARWYALRDSLLGETGGPPPEVIQLADAE